MTEQSKQLRGADPDPEVELVEVVQVDRLAGRRRIVVGVGVLAVLSGAVVWAAVAHTTGPTDASLTRVAAAEVETAGESTTTTETTVAVTETSTEFVPVTVTSAPPAGPSDSGGLTYADFVAALQHDDQGTVDAFCAAHPAPAWHLPNFVGRSVQSPLTASERAAAVWVTGCYHLFDGKITIGTNTIISARRECTTDPSLVDIIFWQEEAAGSVYQTPNHILRLAAYTICDGVPTTVVLPPAETTTTPPPPPPLTFP